MFMLLQRNADMHFQFQCNLLDLLWNKYVSTFLQFIEINLWIKRESKQQNIELV